MTEQQKNIRVLSPFVKGLPFIILIVVLAVIAGTHYLKYAKPVYESTAEVRLADVNEGPSSTNLFKDFDVFAQTNKIQEEVQVIKSNVIINRALDSLKMDKIDYYRIGKIKKSDMYDESPFIVEATSADSLLYDVTFPISITGTGNFTLKDPTDNDKIYEGKLGQLVQMKNGSLMVRKNDAAYQRKPYLQLADDYSFKINDRQSVINKILANLDVTAVDKDVAVLRITYKSSVPQECADVVNAIAQAYIDDYIQNKIKAADMTVKFIDGQLESISGQLSGSENNIQTYRDDNDIINIDQQTESDFRKIAELKIQLANLQMNMAAVDSLVDYLQTNKSDFLALAPNFEAFNDLLSTELVKQIKDLQSQRRDLLTKFTENNPKVKVVEEKIQDLSDYILESCRNTQRNYKVKYDEIYNTIASAESEFDSLPGKEKELAILERYFNLNEKMFNFLNEKKMEAEIARAASISFHRIIQPGIVPNQPVSPNRLFVLALCGFIGLIIAIVLIYLWDTMRPGINNPGKIDKNSDIPNGGKVSLLRRIAKIFPSFKKVAYDMKFKGLLRHGNTLCVSSWSRDEGKSFIANNLANVFVQDGMLTLLISCDDTAEGGIESLSTIADTDKMKFNPRVMQCVRLSESDILSPDFERLMPFVQQIFQMIVIDNFRITDSVAAVGMMRQSHQNMLVLDAFKTSVQSIPEIDLFCTEYNIPHPFFMLNRAGANVISLMLKKLAGKRTTFQQPDFVPQFSPGQI